MSTSFHDAINKCAPYCISEFANAKYRCLDIKDGTGWLPLHLAASNTNPEVLETFLDTMYEPAERNMDLNATTSKEGLTALMICTRNGNLSAVKFLRELGAKVNVQDKLGYTVEHWLAIGSEEHPELETYGKVMRHCLTGSNISTALRRIIWRPTVALRNRLTNLITTSGRNPTYSMFDLKTTSLFRYSSLLHSVQRMF